MAEPGEDDDPTTFGPLRDIEVVIAEGPTYPELAQALCDALAGWYRLIYRTHYPLLRDYEDVDVYDHVAAVLKSAAEHHPEFVEMNAERQRAVLIAHGHDPDLPPRGVSHGDPPPGLRNWVCEVDGHADPDIVGSCIHCYADLP